MNNNQLTEGEQNTCELCADYGIGDCDKCELLKRSDFIDGERISAESEEHRCRD